MSNIFQSFLDFVQGGCAYRSAEMNGQMEMIVSFESDPYLEQTKRMHSYFCSVVRMKIADICEKKHH